MTDNNDKPIPGSIPSSVRKAGAEARIAERKANDEWVHIDDLEILVEEWREKADDCREKGLNASYHAFRECADQLETAVED